MIKLHRIQNKVVSALMVWFGSKADSVGNRAFLNLSLTNLSICYIVHIVHIFYRKTYGRKWKTKRKPQCAEIENVCQSFPMLPTLIHFQLIFSISFSHRVQFTRLPFGMVFDDNGVRTNFTVHSFISWKWIIVSFERDLRTSPNFLDAMF